MARVLDDTILIEVDTTATARSESSDRTKIFIACRISRLVDCRACVLVNRRANNDLVVGLCLMLCILIRELVRELVHELAKVLATERQRDAKANGADDRQQ